jgi:molybdate/tungstate transport system ATP-binding protein
LLDTKMTLSRGTLTLVAEIHDGGFICLSGLNGSGKSTLLNVISGNLRAGEGYVKINSRDVTSLPPERRGVVLVNPNSFIPHLEVEKHLRWGAKAKGIDAGDSVVDETKRALGISYAGRVDKLSLGMRERVALATALLSRPEVILVDEAFSNIDHKGDFMVSFKGLCEADKVDLVHTTQQSAEAALADHHYEILEGTTSRVF